MIGHAASRPGWRKPSSCFPHRLGPVDLAFFTPSAFLSVLGWLGTVFSGKGHPLEKLRVFIGVGDTVRVFITLAIFSIDS